MNEQVCSLSYKVVCMSTIWRKCKVHVILCKVLTNIVLHASPSSLKLHVGILLGYAYIFLKGGGRNVWDQGSVCVGEGECPLCILVQSK